MYVRSPVSVKTQLEFRHLVLTDPNVREAPQANQREIEQRLQLDRERVLGGHLEAIDIALARSDPTGMIRGWVEIGKLLGYYAPERVVKVDVSIAAKRTINELEILSDAELLEMVAAEGNAV